MVRDSAADVPATLPPARSRQHRRSWWTHFAQQLVNGLTLGSLYALIAVGYTVVYGIVQLINFAHGEIFMIGAFGALSTWLIFFEGNLALWVAADHDRSARSSPRSRTAVLMERIAYRPLRHAPGWRR